jgi:hypothetical protein
VVLALVVFGGCVSSSSAPTGPTRYPPRPEDHPIDVFYSPGVDPPKGARPESELPSHVVVGNVDVREAIAATFSRVLKAAKVRGRQLGGDAIIVYRRSVLGADLLMRTQVTVVRYSEGGG